MQTSSLVSAHSSPRSLGGHMGEAVSPRSQDCHFSSVQLAGFASSIQNGRKLQPCSHRVSCSLSESRLVERCPPRDVRKPTLCTASQQRHSTSVRNSVRNIVRVGW